MLSATKGNVTSLRKCASKVAVRIRAAALVLLAAPVCAVAQQTSGGTKFADALFGFDRQGAEQEAQQQRAEADWARAQTELLYQQAQHRRDEEAMKQQTAEIRAALSVWWQKARLSEADAKAFASAYEPSESDAAVISGVRSKGSTSALPAIRSALDSYNYQLANQLLIAFAIVGNEERSKVAPISIGVPEAKSAP